MQVQIWDFLVRLLHSLSSKPTGLSLCKHILAPAGCSIAWGDVLLQHTYKMIILMITVRVNDRLVNESFLHLHSS